MRKFLLGFIAGIFAVIGGTVFANDGIQKIEAYLRPSLPIELNGLPVQLDNPPVIYEGSTYLQLREIAKITGVEVNWNDETQTVELTIGEGKDSMPQSEPVSESEIQQSPVSGGSVSERYEEVTLLSDKIYFEILQLNRTIQIYDNSGKEKDQAYYDAKKRYDELLIQYNELGIIIKELQSQLQ